MKYANVIVDISLEKLDRTFQYRVPEALESSLEAGMQVRVPFGNGGRVLTAYVVELTDECEWDPARMKELLGIVEKGIALEGQLIALASWMKRMYGSTMNQALKYLEDNDYLDLKKLAAAVMEDAQDSPSTQHSLSMAAYYLGCFADLIKGTYFYNSFFYDTHRNTSRLNKQVFEEIQANPQLWALVIFDCHY